MTLASQDFYSRMRGVANRLMDRFENDQSCDIQSQVRTDEGGGTSSRSWTNANTNISLAILPSSGSERQQAQRLQTQTSHTIYIRVADVASIDTKQRIVFDGRTFNINAALNVGEGDAMWKLLCMEGVAT